MPKVLFPLKKLNDCVYLLKRQEHFSDSKDVVLKIKKKKFKNPQKPLFNKADRKVAS